MGDKSTAAINRSFTAAGRRWTIVYGDPGKNALGKCIEETRTIIVRKNLTKEEEIGTVIHEALHAAGYFLSEEAVEFLELAIMGALKATNNLPEEE
jgi:hypothetical protein